jgi:diguanylate cyclase (GGDEF)-like protein
MTSLEKQRVLVVDDAALNVRILCEGLSEEYDISIATNGEDALAIIQATPPDIILLDIMMPGIDGYEVCTRLKADDETRNIPIVFLTAMLHDEDETRSFEVGAADYIRKPVKIPVIKARIRTHLELKRHRDMLENLSTLDGLTGIPNRRRFDEALQRECRRARRLHSAFSLVMLDIDNFKAYNDNYGHIAGDEALKLVARTLAEIVQRPTDVVARYGGEEFVVILPDTDLAGAEFMADRFRQGIMALKIPHEYSPTASVITISLGISSVHFPSEVTSMELVESADRMLYEAKAVGRNTCKSEDLTQACLPIAD